MEITIADEEIINTAIQLNKKNLYKEALEILLEFKIKYADSPKIMGLIGALYLSLNDFKNGSKFSKKATILNPNSEFWSFVLFLSLYNQKFVDTAFDEMDRFLSKPKAIGPLEYYNTTIKELYDQIGETTNKREKASIKRYHKLYTVKAITDRKARN